MIRPFPLIVEGWGPDYVDRVRRLDPDVLDKEAESLFERAAEGGADIPHNDKRHRPGTLSDAARDYLHELRHLAIGKPAPEVEGEDLEGRRFRLSDYRGKVVVLNFGSHFYCGFCRTLYPGERSLVKKLEGRPFALVSINGEPDQDRAALKRAWEAEGNTWRCVWDGDFDGPISHTWNIQQLPTIYVLDHEGVIRHKNVYGQDLDEAVGKLLKDLEVARDSQE
jgi:peroxiredoxin